MAHEGFEAMMAGEDHVVVASLKNKAQVAGASVLSDTAVAAAHARVAE